VVNKAPNSKLQIPNKFKALNLNVQNNCFWILIFEYCNLFGACDFGFVISIPSTLPSREGKIERHFSIKVCPLAK